MLINEEVLEIVFLDGRDDSKLINILNGFLL